MKARLASVAVAIICASAQPASAAQFVATPDIIGPNGYVTSYSGIGGQSNTLGAVGDGGRDAFDGYGYFKVLGGLDLVRQTEFIAGENLFRFLDTLTNNGAETVTRTVTFFGNLGSDSSTFMQARGPGYLTTCQGSETTCSADPVVSATYSGNGLGRQRLEGENYYVDYDLTLAPGESASLLNFAFLTSEQSGTQRSDVVLGAERAFALTSNPYVTGLSDQQLAKVRNFNFNVNSAVPEPGTWLMMLVGFGLVGTSMRRERSALVPQMA